MSDVAIVAAVATLLFFSGFLGVTVGMFWIFDSDRRSCKAQIQALRAEQVNDRAVIVAMQKRINTLAEILGDVQRGENDRIISVTNNLHSGDITAGESVNR
jgi:hypothetical protein